jgi:pyrroloquinoline quinone biosynthesis protein B
MLVHCLGIAAGGGYPQWNCACSQCANARARALPGSPHAGLAVSGTGERWFLLNATPDVHRQIEADPALQPGPGVRTTPLAGVLLTDAEFDHTIGLLVLREGSTLAVYGTPPVLGALSEQFPVRGLLERYADIEWKEIDPGSSVPLDDRLEVTPFAVGAKPPRYLAMPKSDDRWVVGYRLADRVTGAVAVYAPAVAEWDDALEAELSAADCVFVDGTFWTDDEMQRAGTGTRSGADMGHLPISGLYGSAQHLEQLRARRKIYIHVNNTNPILDEDSVERRQLSDLGIEVGWAGLEIEL